MSRKAAATIDEEISTTELAFLCGLTERRVQQLAELGVFEKVRRGRFKRKAAAKAYTDYSVKSEIDRRVEGLNSKEQFEAERARKLKNENDARERLLIEMPAALAAIDLIFGEVRTALSGIAARYTEDVAERRRLEDEIDQVLADLANRLDQAVSFAKSGSADLTADAKDDA